MYLSLSLGSLRDRITFSAKGYWGDYCSDPKSYLDLLRQVSCFQLTNTTCVRFGKLKSTRDSCKKLSALSFPRNVPYEKGIVELRRSFPHQKICHHPRTLRLSVQLARKTTNWLFFFSSVLQTLRSFLLHNSLLVFADSFVSRSG